MSHIIRLYHIGRYCKHIPSLQYLTAGLGSLGVVYIFLNVLDLYSSDQAVYNDSFIQLRANDMND